MPLSIVFAVSNAAPVVVGAISQGRVCKKVQTKSYPKTGWVITKVVPKTGYQSHSHTQNCHLKPVFLVQMQMLSCIAGLMYLYPKYSHKR